MASAEVEKIIELAHDGNSLIVALEDFDKVVVALRASEREAKHWFGRMWQLV